MSGWVKPTVITVAAIGAAYGLMAAPKQLRKTATGRQVLAKLPGV